MYTKIFIGFILLQNVFSFTKIVRLNNPLPINKINKINNINKISTIGIKKTYIKMINKFENNKINTFEKFDWKKNWYPIALESVTDKTKPFEFTLLGNSLVIWWDKNISKWCATDNKCSHRLVPLTEGRITDDGKIECPYHGWCFNSTGNCVKIPHKDNPYYVNNKRFSINSYNIETKQGIIWLWPVRRWCDENNFKPSSDLIPTSPPIDNGMMTDDFSLDLPYDYSLLLENIMDISHVPYTHHGSQGNRNLVKPIKYNITENITNKGFKLDIKEGFGKHTLFKAPCYQHTYLNIKRMNLFNIFKSNKKNRDEDRKTFINAWVVAYAIPKSPGYSRIIARFPIQSPNKFLTKFLLFGKPAFIRHMGRNEVLEEDTIFLHQQEKELLLKDKNYYNYNNTHKYYKLATEADIPVLLWRKWLNEAGPIPWGGDKIVKNFNNKKELINREEFHLKHCKICQNVYKKLESIKKYIIYIKPLIFILVWPLLSYYYPNRIYINRFISLSLIISTSIIWYICTQLQIKMKFGKYPPNRNNIKTNLFKKISN
tara:strand:- start:6004 stop:7632 length:1629 start_codon:yes stop_codon:yes gene_type:complete